MRFFFAPRASSMCKLKKSSNFIKKIDFIIDKIKLPAYTVENAKERDGTRQGKAALYRMVTKMGREQYHAPAKCPVCGQTMEVTRLQCTCCGSELTGRFSPCRFCALEEKHLSFIETFLRCRGSIKEVEKELGVSYPTVKNMLEAALGALQLESPQERQARRKEEKADVLSRLSQGELTVEQAVEELNRLRGKN